MTETWRDVKGYEGLYLISSLGRLKRKTTGKILKERKFYDGYIVYALCKHGKVRQVGAHRLVAEAFIENHNEKPCVNHIDSNRSNNAIENLEWVTHQENSIHGVRHGNAFRNSKKLNWAQVNLIREMYEWSEKNAVHRLVKPFTHKWLAKCFNVSPSTIGWITKRETWVGER